MRKVLALLSGLLMITSMGLVVPAATAADVSQPNIVQGTPVDFTPHVLDGIVFSIAEAGNTIVLGGSFTQVQASSGGPVLARNGIVAFNKNTGQISTSFAPQFNSTVRSVVTAADGQSVYVGGQFGTLNGSSVPKVTRLALSNGSRINSFDPGLIDAVVHDMKLSGDRLFIGGAFTTVGGENRSMLAELEPATGDVRSTVDFLFEGVHRGGDTFVHKFDVTPDGQTMVVTGNFSTIDGFDRVQVGMIDLSTSPASVADWQTDRWKANCYASFAYYLNDLDIAPDGSYFVLGSMGGYGSGPPSLCDSVSRWDTSERGTAIDPTWIDYTGGDSVYALEATGPAVYFGGHNRWMNNPFRADAQGQGAVDREGIGALSAVNGVPMAWNPGRDRGRGVFDLLATEQGVWVGSDTDRIARYLYHGRIALFPLAGGSEIPVAVTPELPVDVLQSGALGGPVDQRYLYRVNGGGSTIPAIDAGPDWLGDTAAPGSSYRNTGNAAAYDVVGEITAAVPASTPLGVFSTERWDDGAAPEMKWSFPVPAGTNAQVRIYLADRCSCTDESGERVFSMTVDEQMAFENYDINAAVGHNVGTMLSQDIVSDGTVDVEFLHVTENSLVNAIEIVDLDEPAPDAGTVDQMNRLHFDGSEAAAGSPSLSGSVPWDSVRGGFVADESLYLAMSNGQLHQRSFDGTQIGGPTELNLNGLTNFAADMQSMTGMFYSNGRIYFTLGGDPNLYMRYFEIESGIVGAQRFVIADTASGVDWSGVRGMFLADDQLYWAAADGNLRQIGWTETVGDGAVSGMPAVVSGPANDGIDWGAKSLIAIPGTVPPGANELPVASFVDVCDGLGCVFDGSGSSDPDGSVAEFAWTSSDGGSGSGAVFEHEFAAAGSYDVALTVTDDDGASAELVREITVEVDAPVNELPVASFVDACEDLTCVFDGSGSSDPDGTVAAYAWSVGAATAAGEVFSHTFDAAGSYDVTLTVTDNSGAVAELTRPITVTAATGPAPTSPVSFVASASGTNDGSARNHSLVLPVEIEAGDVLVAMFSANSGTVEISAPEGWDVSAEASTRSLRSVLYSRVATAEDAGSTLTVGTASYTRGSWVVTVYRDAQISAASFELEAETISQAAHTTPVMEAAAGDWVLSYWADKTASTTSWEAPAGVAVRETGAGPGAGHLSWLIADSNGPVEESTVGGLTATANSATSNAVMGTITLAAASAPVEPGVNEVPVASFVDVCDGLGCVFDGSGSSDPDGSVAEFAWTSSDGGSGSGAVFEHEFAAAGSYDVALTVTDDDGASAELVREITVEVDAPVNELPVASFVDACEDLTCVFDGSGSSDPDGTVAAYAWSVGAATAAGEVFSHTFDAAGSYDVTLTVTDNSGAVAELTRPITVTAATGPAPTSPVSFVASASGTNDGSARNHSLVLPVEIEAGDVLVAMFSANSGTVEISAPEGWDVSAEASTRSLRSVLYSRVATAEDAGSTLTVGTASYTRGSWVVTVYRDAQISAASFELEAETISQAAHTTPVMEAAAGDWVLSYWADKTASTTSWEAPAGVAVRETGAGPGAGHLSWLIADSNGPVEESTVGGLTATANSATGNAVMGTIVLTAAAP